MSPKVSVIIVNWNGARYLDSCIQSVLSQRYVNFDILVVDNASTDLSVENIKRQYPKVQIVCLDKNYGFAGANNIGIKKAITEGSEFVALLNNDTKVAEGWLEELVKAMERDDKIGICASKILRMKDPRIIDSAGHYFIDGIIRDRGSEEIDKGQYDNKTDIVGGCAAASLYRRAMLDAIGLFDDSYGFYYEDIELSWRAYNSGWKAVFVPASVVYHVRGGTTIGNKALGEELRKSGIVNLIRTVRRHASLKQRIVLSLIWLKEAARQWLEVGMRENIIKSEYVQRLALLWAKKI